MSYGDKTEILYLSANPLIDSRGPADEREHGYNYEASYIQNGIRSSRYGDRIRFDAYYYVSKENIISYLQDYQPEVLHIACRMQNEKLILAGSTVDSVQLITVEEFLEILKLYGSSVKLLVLRILNSKKLADRIAAETGIKTVLHLGNKKNLKGWHQFISTFYELVCNGINLRKSYNLAHSTSYVSCCGLISDKETGNSCLIGVPEGSDCFALLLASTPLGRGKLHFMAGELDQVTGMVENGICTAIYPSSTKEIMMAIAYYQPKVVLISSHGSMDYLLLCDEDQNENHINKDWLVDLFKEFRDTVESVVFSSCENMAIAYAVSKHVPYVIGTTESVFDDVATTMTKHYFTALLENKDYQEAFDTAKQNTREEFTGDFEALKNIEVYQFFRREDYQKSYKKCLKELLNISRQQILSTYAKNTGDLFLRQISDRFMNWSLSIRNNQMTELSAAFARHSRYVSFQNIGAFLIYEYQAIINKTDPHRVAYLPLCQGAGSRDVNYWMLFKCLTSASPDYTWLNFKEGKEKISEVFDVILINGFLPSQKEIIDFVIQNQSILRTKRVTILTLACMYEELVGIQSFLEQYDLDIRIQALFQLDKAFVLSPKFESKKRNFQKHCLNLGMAEEDILGSEALCFFYDSVPKQTLGIFTHETEGFAPLLSVPEYQVPAAKPVTKERYEELQNDADTRARISLFLRTKKTGFTIEELAEEAGLSIPELRIMLDIMTWRRSSNRYFADKTEMREIMNPTLRAISPKLGDKIGSMDLL